MRMGGDQIWFVLHFFSLLDINPPTQLTPNTTADMHTKGVSYIHLYEEGNDLDFNIGLYFYEKLIAKIESYVLRARHGLSGTTKYQPTNSTRARA
jgi:hypothetical protein